jgi:chorismate mutase
MSAPDKPAEQTPAPLPEVTPPTAPVIVGGVEEYGSSEEFARAHAVGLAKQEEDKKKLKAMTDKQRVKAVLDKYIEKHNTVKAVRARIKENGQPVNKHTLEIQFEVSDAIAAELTKIKNELR